MRLRVEADRAAAEEATARKATERKELDQRIWVVGGKRRFRGDGCRVT